MKNSKCVNWKVLSSIIVNGRYLLLPLALLLFTAYAFIQPGLKPRLQPVSFIIMILCILQLIFNKNKNSSFAFNAVYWILGYIVLGLISIVLPPTYLASESAWIDAAKTITIGLIIWSAFSTADQRTEKIFEWFVCVLCFLFAGAILLQNIDGGYFSPRKLTCLVWLTTPLHEWLQKYQEIWLLLLTWVGIAFLPFSGKGKQFIVWLMLLLCGLALFSGYSQGSRLAFILSVLFFAYGTITNKFPGKLLAVLVVGVVITIPVCWAIGSFFPKIAAEYTNILNIWHDHRLMPRSVIWSYALQVILVHPWTGFGFGAAHTITLPLYPGNHPHSITIMILLDFGLLGLAFFMGFLFNIMLRISRAQVSLSKTMAAASLMLSCLIYWQASFSFWNPECFLLLFISAGLMGLRLRNRTAEEPIPAYRIIKHFNGKRTILALLCIGIIACGINYMEATDVNGRLKYEKISLSKDLNKLIINGKALLISKKNGGILRIIAKDTNDFALRGWAGDISEGKKAQALILFYETNKISIIIPTSYSPGLASINTNLLFSGFSCIINKNEYNFRDIEKIRGVALFNNGEARFLKCVPFIWGNAL